MRILSLDIAGFGRLRGAVQFGARGMTIVVAPNESGKTTLAEAIRAVLYGLRFEPGGPPAHRYRPWDGGAYGVAADIESADRTLRIERDFASGAVRAPAGMRPEQLTGLTDQEFARVAILRHEIAPGPHANASLAARIERMVEAETAVVSSGEALDALRRARGSDALRTLHDDLARAEDERRLADTAYDAACARGDALAVLAERDDALAREQAAIEIATARARIEDAQERARRAAERSARQAELQREREGLAGDGIVPEAYWDRVTQLAARFRLLDEKRRAADRSVKELTARTREMEHALADEPALAALTAADAVAADACASRLERAQATCADAEEALRAAEAAVRTPGDDPQWMRTLLTRLGTLSDEERSFLARYREARAKLHAALERDRLSLVEAEETHATAGTRTTSERGLLLWLAGTGGVVALLAGLPLLFTMAAVTNFPPALLPAIAGGGGALGLGAAIAASWQSRQRARVERELTQTEDDLRAAMRTKAAGLVRMEAHLGELAHTLGAPPTRDLLADMDAAPHIVETLDPLVQRAETARGALATARAEVDALLARAERSIEPEADAAEGARVLARDLRAREERQSALRVESERKAAVKAELTALLQEGGALVAEIEEVAHASGAHDDDPLGLLERLEDGVVRARRLSALDAEVAGAVALAEREQPDPHAEDTVRALEARIAELSAFAADAAAPRPTNGGGASREQRLTDIARERATIATERGALLDGVRREAADAAARRADASARVRSLRRRVAEAERFAAAIELAEETLSAVVSDSHETWADVLTAHCGAFLESLTQGTGTIAFAPDLSIAVVRPDGRRLDTADVSHVLSAGARDQIELAVRLAIARFLAREGDGVPFILDEPFQTADDDRAMRGLRFLAREVAPRHQVIVLTCQATRIDTFLAQETVLAGVCTVVKELPS